MDSIYYMPDQITKLAKSSKSDEHLTPQNILQFARTAMGCSNFDLDPATTDSNPTEANTFYTQDDNGLVYPWTGNVWVNPPFSLNKPFAQKVVANRHKYNQCIYLAKNDFRTSWSNILLNNCDHMIVINDYVTFVGSKHSAVFSVVLYCFNTTTLRLQYACKKHPNFLLFTPNK